MIKDKDANSLAGLLCRWGQDTRLIKFRCKDLNTFLEDAFGLHVQVNIGAFIDKITFLRVSPSQDLSPENLHKLNFDPVEVWGAIHGAVLWDKRTLLIQDHTDQIAGKYNSTFTAQYLPKYGCWGCLIEFPHKELYPYITRRDWMIYIQEAPENFSHLEMYTYDDPYVDDEVKEVPTSVQMSLL